MSSEPPDSASSIESTRDASKLDASAPAVPATKPRPLYKKVLPFALGALAIAAVVYSLRDADPRATLDAIVGLGPAAPLVLVPYLVGTVFHAAAWQRLVPGPNRPSVASLLRIMLTSEAVRMTLPAGAALAESSSVLFLRDRHGVPAAKGVATIAAKKALVTLTHGISVLLALALGYSLISAASRRMFGGPWLVVFLLVSAFALMGVAAGTAIALLSKKTLARATHVLALLPIGALRRYLERKRAAIDSADRDLAAPFEKKRDLVLPGVYLFAQWMCETAETVLILRLLGVDLAFVASMATELTAVLLRSFAFLVPAGVGVQDASYVTMFDALSGTRLATMGAAFVLIKRGKEIFWIAAGYGLLALHRRREEPREGETSPQKTDDSGATDTRATHAEHAPSPQDT